MPGLPSKLRFMLIPENKVELQHLIAECRTREGVMRVLALYESCRTKMKACRYCGFTNPTVFLRPHRGYECRACFSQERKRCVTCGQSKPADTDHFYANLKAKSGLQGSCIPCQLAREKARRDAGIRKRPTGRTNRVGEDYRYKPTRPARAAEAAALEKEGRRRCPRCEEIKPLDGFHFKRGGSGKLTRACLGCLFPAGNTEEALERERRRIHFFETRLDPEEAARRNALHKHNWREQKKARLAAARAEIEARGLVKCRGCRELKPHDFDHFGQAQSKSQKPGIMCLACNPDQKRFPRGQAPKLSDAERVERKRARDEQRRRARGQTPRVLLDPEEAARREANQRREARKRRRARERGAEGSHTEEELLQKTAAHGFRCYWSGLALPAERSEYDAEHLIPLALGGSNRLENVAAADREVNGRKRELMPWDFLGITYPQWLAGKDQGWTWRPRVVGEVEKTALKAKYPRYPVSFLSRPLKIS